MKVQDLLTKGYDMLKANKIDSYIIDCQLLLAKVLNCDRMSIILNRDRKVEEDKCSEYFELIKLRSDKMPIKYLTEETEFMGIPFYVKQGVLIPRPDTEILVEELLQLIDRSKNIRICDVCCGSGAIGLSIAKFVENAEVYCGDISPYAEEVTKKNIELLSLGKRTFFVRSDLLEFAITQKLNFQVIVSNPPYIRKDVIPTLMEDVKDYEPFLALCGGDDGLEFYRVITKQSQAVLNDGGILAYEIGHDQGEAVVKILESYGFVNVRIIKDLSGFDRVVLGYKS